MKSLWSTTPASPVLSADALRALAHEILGMATADWMAVSISHVATGITRVAKNRVQLNNSGDTLQVELHSQFGERREVALAFNQTDSASVREAMQHVERVAHDMLGDPALTPRTMPIPARTYLPNSASKDATIAALVDERHTVVPALVQPMLDAKLISAAFVGVVVRSTLYADTQGMMVAGQDTDAELTVTGWNSTSTSDVAASGWAGQAARDWRTLNPSAVATEAVRMTRLAANPVALEPGRRLTILGRPAVAQIVRAMGRDYDAASTIMGATPLSPFKIHDKVLDERLTLLSDPNDPDGGYLPFNMRGFPLVAMSWLDRGRLANLAYGAYYAAQAGVSPANDYPESMRLSGPSGAALVTIEEMIANCKEGIYVNRLANVEVLHPATGVMTGVTNGGCFLVRNGKIEKAVKDFRFVDSPYFFLNRLEAVGTYERTAFGYAPWHGEWPIAPTIVPPLVVRDFNFTAFAETV